MYLYLFLDDYNDIEAVKIIEDYYWFEYYLESLRFDWESLYYRERKQINKHKYCDKDVCNIIRNNLNEVELDKLKSIFFTYLTDILIYTDDNADDICITGIIGYMIKSLIDYIKIIFRSKIRQLNKEILFYSRSNKEIVFYY